MIEGTDAGTFGVMSAGAAAPIAMQRLHLSGRVTLAGARLRLDHQFRAAEAMAEAVYAFGLPRDAALRRFRIEGEDFSVASELRATEVAEREYEEGLEAGHLSGLVRQFQDGLVNLALGAVRAGEKVTVALEMLAGVERRARGLRFRFPFCLPPGYHAGAASGWNGEDGEQQLPAAQFGDLLLPVWRERPDGVHVTGFRLRLELPQTIASVASPSHPLRVTRIGEREVELELATEGDLPNRDLVLEVETERPLRGVVSGVDQRGRGRFFAAVAASELMGEGEAVPSPCRLVLVLDRSGSMSDGPMAQARAVASGVLRGLGVDDELGVIAFDDVTESWAPVLVRMGAGDATRRKALEFIAGIESRGGTALNRALGAALSLLDGRGEVLLITDGQVFGTGPILKRARESGVRVHCLGIGEASRERFASQLAGQSGGGSRWLGLGESAETAALEFLQALRLASALDLGATVTGEFKGQVHLVSGGLGSAPVEVWGETGSAGATALRLGWRRSDSGEADRLELPCEVRPDADTGEMLRLLYGARLIADLESGSVSRERLAALSQEYGLASRAMSLVAVARRAGDQSGLLPRTAVMPLAMPLGVTGAAYFGQASLDSIADVIGAPLYRFEARRRAIGDLIAADGGIEGADLAERMARTLMAMLLLARRDPDGGEMRQLVGFARSRLAELADSGQRDLCRKVLSAVAAGAAPAPDDTPDDTPEIAVIEGATWEAVAQLMRCCAAKVMR